VGAAVAGACAGADAGAQHERAATARATLARNQAATLPIW
jgi:hypothetical protein